MRHCPEPMKWFRSNTILLLLFPLVPLLLLGGCARPVPNTPAEEDVGGQEEGAPAAVDEEAVKFKALHDWSRIELQDGRHLQVVFARTNTAAGWFTEDELERLAPGHPLRLKWLAGQVVLSDPTGNRTVPVVGGDDGEHPLDRWIKRQSDSATTQFDLHISVDTGVRRWRSAISQWQQMIPDRFGHLLTPEFRQALRLEQEDWERLRRRRTEIDRHAPAVEGSRWRFEDAEEELRLERAFARMLAQRIARLQAVEQERAEAKQ
jgi:hypothetical protein